MLVKKSDVTKYLPLVLIFAALQFFLSEFLVAGSWRGDYSYSDNYISDLGVPYCGPHGTAPCSTSSVLLTVSFVILGAALLVCAIWVRQAGPTPLVGTVFLAAAGIGALVVGLVPSNTNWPLHSLGASLFLIFGSCSALTIGLSAWTRHSAASFLTAPLGLLALVGYFCYANGWQWGLGPGGIERVSAYSVIAGFVCTVLMVNENRPTARHQLHISMATRE